MSNPSFTLEALLTQAVAQQASDLHLCAGQPPMVRQHGALTPLHAHPAISAEALQTLLAELLDEKQLAQFAQGHELDFAFAMPESGRFRANAFLQHNGCGVVMRHIPTHIPSLASLNAPSVLADLLCKIGLLLVTGPTGSGKSTTLAAMVQHLNSHTQQHIVTLEDPIEFVHASDQCLITQREMGTHSRGFSSALRAALREDPDVILVGELRDLETIRLALTAAETGHLVLASLHTRSAPATIDRIVDVFDAHEKALVRAQLSEALVGVLSQTLCPKSCGTARIALFETLVATPAVRHLIREGKTAHIQSVLQTSAAVGMQTLQQALDHARAEGRIA